MNVRKGVNVDVELIVEDVVVTNAEGEQVHVDAQDDDVDEEVQDVDVGGFWVDDADGKVPFKT